MKDRLPLKSWLAAPLVLTLSACAKQPPPPSCKEVADHAVDVMGSDTPEQRDELSRTVVANCADRSWSAEARRCLVSSADMASYAECARAERIRRGQDMGGPSCEEIVQARHQRMPFASDKSRKDNFVFCRGMTREIKECILAIPPSAPDVEYWEKYGVCRAKDAG